MSNDRFSDTTELPVPRLPREPQEPDYPDPFAAESRRSDRPYRAQQNNGAAPRMPQNGSQSRPQQERAQHRNPQNGSPYRAQQDGMSPRPDHPNGAPVRRRLNGAASPRQNGGYSAGNGTPQRQVQQAPRQRVQRPGTNPPTGTSPSRAITSF